MRERHICPKCDHREILRIAEIPDTVGDRPHERVGGAAEHQRIGKSIALRLARLQDSERFLAASGPTAGLVRAYACRKCGYTELYTDNVAEIPIDGNLVTLLRGPDQTGPYR